VSRNSVDLQDRRRSDHLDGKSLSTESEETMRFYEAYQIHYRRGSDLYGACGLRISIWMLTMSVRHVTCLRCRKTRLFQEAKKKAEAQQEMGLPQ
jgi:hypothetical protein